MKKEGAYRRFKVGNFQETDMPTFDHKKLFEEEEKNLKKELETEKQKKENMKKIVNYNNSKSHLGLSPPPKEKLKPNPEVK